MGGGVRWFDQQSKKYARDGQAPELYLVRPNLNFGLKLGAFEAIVDLQFQSENKQSFQRKFKGRIQTLLPEWSGFIVWANREFPYLCRDRIQKTLQSNCRCSYKILECIPWFQLPGLQWWISFCVSPISCHTRKTNG